MEWLLDEVLLLGSLEPMAVCSHLENLARIAVASGRLDPEDGPIATATIAALHQGLSLTGAISADASVALEGCKRLIRGTLLQGGDHLVKPMSS